MDEEEIRTETVEFEVNSCYEETLAPYRVIVVNKESGEEVFSATIKEPLWSKWSQVQYGINPETDPVGFNASMTVACIHSWSVDLPITVNSLYMLAPEIQQLLLTQANKIAAVKAGQMGNSDAPSTSTNTPQKSEPKVA